MLTVVMALSLVVVAGAAETGKTVNLRIEPAMKDEEAKDKTELTYYVYLEPQDDAEVGAAQFTLTAPEGATFKSVEFNTEYVYDDSKENPVVGSANGIFAKSAITSDSKGGNLGGQLESDKRSFRAILAGTNREERMLTANTSTEKGYTNAWLYEVTLTVPKFDGNTNYTIGVKDATAGYNGDSKETDSVNDLTMRHTVNVSSKGYGGILGDVNGDGTINGVDTNLLYRYVMGYINEADMTSQQKQLADVNGDGTINGVDTNLLYRYVMGYVDSFN